MPVAKFYLIKNPWSSSWQFWPTSHTHPKKLNKWVLLKKEELTSLLTVAMNRWVGKVYVEETVCYVANWDDEEKWLLV